MIAIVIPAKNEENRIGKVLNTCSKTPADIIIPVINGCTDDTKGKVENHFLKDKIKILEFCESLGIDVPRAIGAAYAYRLKAQVILFVDGDMTGDIEKNLNELIKAIQYKKIDMALTNCYPFIYCRNALANSVLKYREKLNRELGLFDKIGLATPSHGPHAISRKLMQEIPWSALAIPPLSLAIAKEKKLKIKVVSSLPHASLFSPLRSAEHSDNIAQTIIGDCLEALHYIKKSPPSRWKDRECFFGYHLYRRLDILDNFLRL